MRDKKYLVKAKMTAFCGLLRVILIALVTGLGITAVGQPTGRELKPPKALPAAEFARLIREFSEEGGYFPSDNFTSNESSYLTVVEKLGQLGATGGAYIGVGPEQNFTYIAKVRPRIAFIVDIRRQALIQHMMYKAIFHLAPTRTHFLSLLLSKPLPQRKDRSKIPAPEATINELISFFEGIVADDKTYADNLVAIRKTIQKDFAYPLSEADLINLDYVYKSFRTEGLEIGFRLMGRPDGSGFGPGGMGLFPKFKELLAQTDQKGRQGSFLASRDDYDFVRQLHRKNLILPVVGDFAGKKALTSVGDYLRKNGYTVTAFYTSNVEMVLFRSGSFPSFVNNVRSLPADDRSLIIRAGFSRYSHPAQLPGYGTFTLMQRVPIFLKDYDEGLYTSYRELIMTHYIADDPVRPSPPLN